MSSIELERFLQEEEMVPSVFQKDCPGVGFIVNPEMDDATIPSTYKANLPFWLAEQMANEGLVSIGQPIWVQKLGPGAVADTDRSFVFASKIRIASKSRSQAQPVPTETPITQLCKERIEQVINLSMRTERRALDPQSDDTLFHEEKTIVQSSQKAVQQFHDWKSCSNQSTLKSPHKISIN